MAGWIAAALVAVLAGVIWQQHRAARGTYRPLSSRQPARPGDEKTPLGMEAMDLDQVARTTRANETLERGNTSWTRGRGGVLATRASETDVRPWADDETYAARFYAAFHKDRSKDSAK